MAANAIDNTNLKDKLHGDDLSGFIPNVTYAYDAAAKTVEFTHSSTFPAGDSVKAVHVRVHDHFGGEVRESPVSDGSADADGVISVATLDTSKGLILTATITSEKGLAADGSVHNIAAAGALGAWDKQKNAKDPESV